MMLSPQKHLFDLDDSITYLNGAYMSPQLKSVTVAGLIALGMKSNPQQIGTAHFFSGRQELQEKFAQLIEASDPRNIAIIPSASYGIANAANNLNLKEGDEIIIVAEQFPSNVYVWQQLAKKAGAIIKIVGPPEGLADRGKKWNQKILAAIGRKTAAVAMAHVHWADGTLFDLGAIRAKTRDFKSMLIIDGTQSVGALPFSVKTLQPDALICAGYKWLMGPYSLGVAYYSDAFNDGEPIEHNWINRKNSEDFRMLTQYQDAFQAKAGRFSVGESSNFALLPMLIKAIDQLLAWGPANIQDYCRHISSDSIGKLVAAGHFVESDLHRASHLFGIYVKETERLQQIKNNLVGENVFVSYRGDAIRVSPNVYNTTRDFDKLTSCFMY
jgi:selenocysteine lyase/cysteine desulfurase